MILCCEIFSCEIKFFVVFDYLLYKRLPLGHPRPTSAYPGVSPIFPDLHQALFWGARHFELGICFLGHPTPTWALGPLPPIFQGAQIGFPCSLFSFLIL